MEFINVNHSIPDAVALGINTRSGTWCTPATSKSTAPPFIGKMIDLTRFGELGNEGVLALMADSTNAERPGLPPSERVVGKASPTCSKRRRISGSSSPPSLSNIHRIQQIIDAAVKDGRKVAVSGRSMINVVSIATELGLPERCRTA